MFKVKLNVHRLRNPYYYFDDNSAVSLQNNPVYFTSLIYKISSKKMQFKGNWIYLNEFVHIKNCSQLFILKAKYGHIEIF